MIRWHHRLSRCEFEQAPGDGEGQGSLACCSPWGRRELGRTERVNNTQSCLTLCDPTDCSPPGSSVHGFPRQEYWSGLPFPTPGGPPTQRPNLHLPQWQADYSVLSHEGMKLFSVYSLVSFPFHSQLYL